MQDQKKRLKGRNIPVLFQLKNPEALYWLALQAPLTDLNFGHYMDIQETRRAI